MTLAADAANLLTALGAETITYKPSVGDARNIGAIVQRPGPRAMDGAPDGIIPALIIHVLNDSTEGISSDELNLGGDKVTVALREGETPVDRAIKALLSVDSAMMELELR